MLLSTLDKHVLATLRDRALGRKLSTPAIAVVGNCQSFGVAYATKLLSLHATVHRFPVLTKSRIDVKLFAKVLANYDHVFLQWFPEGFVRGGSAEALRERLRNIIWYPALAFTGYHPDSIFVSDQTKGGAPIFSPIGPYHSAIAFFAYRAGLPADAALRLFEREVFEALGYFDVWKAAAEQFLGLGKGVAIDLSADFMRWTRRGCFMYSINHPKPHVLFDLARQLLEKAGIPINPINFDNYAVDDLVQGVVYPVYPPIAELYGIEGSYVFKGADFAIGRQIKHFWDLRDFVRECYRIYSGYDRKALTNERVEAWLQNDDLAKFLRDVAARG